MTQPPTAQRVESVARAMRGGAVPPIALVLSAYVAVACACILLHPFGESALWVNVASIPVALITTLLCFAVVRHPSIDDRSRQAWRLIAIAHTLRLVGDVSWFVVESVQGLDPTCTWVDIPYLSFYPLMLAGLLRFPLLIGKRSDALAFWLDVATTTVGGGMLLGYFLIWPALASGSGSLSSLLPAAYPVGDLVILVGIARLLLRRPPGEARRPLDLIGIALLVNTGGNVLWAALSSMNDYATGGLADAFWLVSYALTACGAALAWRRPTLRLGPSQVLPPAFSLAPYLAVALGYGLVVWVGVIDAHGALPVLIGAAVLMSGLVVARQILALRQVARLEGEHVARASEMRFRTLVQNSSDAIVVLAPDGMVRYVSESSIGILGQAPPTLLGRSIADFAHPDDAERVRAFLAEAVERPGQVRSLTWRFQRASAPAVLLETVATNLIGDPSVGGLVTNSRDVTERKALEDQLVHQAFHDALTGLPNRALFRDRVDHALARSLRGDKSVSVVFLDLDNFKNVNDSLGHVMGDRILLAAAERIRRCLRSGDTASRLGGDEFGVLIEEGSDSAYAASIAARLADSFRESFLVDGRDLVVTASVGVAAAEDGDTADVVLRNADAAMYVAKSRGRGRWEHFAPAMHAAALAQLELRGDLHHAIERQEFSLAYQPIVSLPDGRVCAAEALLRWTHPARGSVPPAAFIPLAEQTGLIVPIGAWVIEQACQDAAQWRRARPEGTDEVYVSVNLSVRQLQNPRLLEEVEAALETSGIPPSALAFEITESGLVEQRDLAIETLGRLRALGARIAVDDFGTGYSSLEYLQRLPIDVLKIPKPFIDGLSQADGDATLPRAILSIAATLGLDVVAEGIEAEEQVRCLAELGCELGQGYLFARPMPLADLCTLGLGTRAAQAVRTP